MQELSQKIVKLEGHVPKLLDSHELSKSFNMMEYVNTGDLLWKITDIRRRRKEAASGEIPYIYSQPFYTSANGYKMCAKLYLNGDGMGQGTHISLFFAIMKGEYDFQLPWPFVQQVTMVLIDQNGCHHIADTVTPYQSPSFKKPQSDMNIALGCPMFIPLATVDDGRYMYVKNDTMFIKIMVASTVCYPTTIRESS